MILTNVKESVPIQPVEGGSVFMIRAGSVMERGQMEAELSGQWRAGRVATVDVLDAMRSGVEALLAEDPEEQEIALDLIARKLAIALAPKADAESEQLSEDEIQQLARYEVILGEHWQPMIELNSQIARRHEMAPLLALRRFCTSIEGTGTNGHKIEFKRGVDGMVADATLSAINPNELIGAGLRAYAMQYGWAESGNSQRPGTSDAGQTTSASSDEPSKEGGKSKAKGGRKTQD